MTKQSSEDQKLFQLDKNSYRGYNVLKAPAIAGLVYQENKSVFGIVENEELLRIFFGGFAFVVFQNDDASKLFVREGEDVDLAFGWNVFIDQVHQTLQSFPGAAVFGIDRELAHAEALFFQKIPEFGGYSSFIRVHHGEIEHHHDPHQPVPIENFSHDR